MKLRVFCGQSELQWDRLSASARSSDINERFDRSATGLMSLLERGGNVLENDTVRIKTGQRYRNQPLTAQANLHGLGIFKHYHLFDVLDATRNYQCFDPRDRLYAINSLFDERTPDLLRPDYTKSVETVYADLSYFLLQRDDTVVLSAAAHSKSTLGMPSWTVDWRKPPSLAPLLIKLLPNATTGFQPGQRQVLSSRPSTSTLVLRGLSITRVSASLAAGHFLQIATGIAGGPISGLYSRYLLEDDGTKSSNACAADFLGLRGYSGENIKLKDAEVELERIISSRSLFLTEDGRRGLGPLDADMDDFICVLIGFEIPFLLRETSAGWKVIGEVFMKDIMLGQAVANLDWTTIYEGASNPHLRDFELC